LFDFTVFPVLETQRLILREIVSADAEAIFTLRSDAEVTKFNGVPTYVRIEQAHELIESMVKCYYDKRELRWGLTLKGDDRLIGGIMPEALRAIIEFGFERMALNRIEADASAENIASIRVLHKLGFQREGLQREQYFEYGEFHDLVLFSLLRGDYFGANSTWVAQSSTSSL
jgi:ribosomal-protein-alanine N-acetyltransferase